jgi:hypothetical protein
VVIAPCPSSHGHRGARGALRFLLFPPDASRTRIEVLCAEGIVQTVFVPSNWCCSPTTNGMENSSGRIHCSGVVSLGMIGQCSGTKKRTGHRAPEDIQGSHACRRSFPWRSTRDSKQTPLCPVQSYTSFRTTAQHRRLSFFDVRSNTVSLVFSLPIGKLSTWTRRIPDPMIC